MIQQLLELSLLLIGLKAELLSSARQISGKVLHAYELRLLDFSVHLATDSE